MVWPILRYDHLLKSNIKNIYKGEREREKDPNFATYIHLS